MDEKVQLKVLYVEDEPDLRERIRIVLEMHFSRVCTAANGSEGLDAFSRELPDVVVSDIMMPVMDGLELARRIGEIAPDTPIILSTAFTETSYLLRAIEMGVRAYVRKPLDCRELIATIVKAGAPVLQRRELEQSRRNEQGSLELFLGDSPAMQQVVRQAQRIARTDFSVVILGETGVGKSRLARERYAHACWCEPPQLPASPHSNRSCRCPTAAQPQPGRRPPRARSPLLDFCGGAVGGAARAGGRRTQAAPTTGSTATTATTSS